MGQFNGFNQPSHELAKLGIKKIAARLGSLLRGSAIPKLSPVKQTEPVFSERFPAIPDKPILPWVQHLSPADRREYEESKDGDIAAICESYQAIIAGLPDFNVVPQDAIDYLSYRIAAGMKSLWEVGVQLGLDTEDSRTEAELRQLRLEKSIAIGNN